MTTKSHWWHPIVKRMAAFAPIAKLLAHTLPSLDRYVVRRSNGRHSLTTILTGLPIVTLTTIGAKSGQKRTVPLVGLVDDQKVILIASNWGQTRHPGWHHNLRANPEVTIMFDGHTNACIAREATADERTYYWSEAVGLYAGYAAYKRRTGGRRIPMWVLEPA